MSTKLTYTGAEVQELLDKIEKGDFDNAKTLEGHPASYFAIASEFTSLAASFATEQGRVNTLHSYFNNGSANDALSLDGKLPSYYATATQYEILQRTLSDFKSLFDSMFEKDSAGNIHAKLSLWSSGGITAGGVGSGGSGGGGGASYDRLDTWADYSVDKSGWVLSALLGNDLNTRLISVENAGYVTQSALAPYALRSEIPSLVGYATESWVNTALAGYLPLSGGTLTGKNGILALKSTNSSSYIAFDYNNTRKATVGVFNGLAYIANETIGTCPRIGVNDSGIPQYWDGYEGKNKYTLLHSGNYSDLLANGTINGTITAPSFIGNLTGNADSATKLATPRTIWGQSFDGTGNINGAIDVSLVASALDIPVIKFASDCYFDKYGNYVFGESAGSFSVFNGSHLNAIFHVLKTGNVAIGAKTADEKLHVYGNGKFTGSVTASSLTIGGATITYDSANNALCINGNMYALGGITAGGAGISAYTSLEARVARLEQRLNIS